jgi:hypothetical protein
MRYGIIGYFPVGQEPKKRAKGKTGESGGELANHLHRRENA